MAALRASTEVTVWRISQQACMTRWCMQLLTLSSRRRAALLGELAGESKPPWNWHCCCTKTLRMRGGGLTLLFTFGTLLLKPRLFSMFIICIASKSAGVQRERCKWHNSSWKGRRRAGSSQCFTRCASALPTLFYPCLPRLGLAASVVAEQEAGHWKACCGQRGGPWLLLWKQTRGREDLRADNTNWACRRFA